MLAIETATEACSVALLDDGRLLANCHVELGRGHAERLVPMIADLPGKGRADQIRVSLGPGSFTGVRVGLAAARALGVAWQVPVVGYPTPALVCAMARRKRAEPLAVVMNGGHGEWFVCNFDGSGRMLSPAVSLPPERAAEYANGALLAGNRAQELARLSETPVEAFDLLPDARFAELIDPSALLASPVPLYGRAPDARPRVP